MTTIVKKEIKRIDVFPLLNGLANVIGRVIWSLVFSRNGSSTEASIETLLDVEDLSDFVPIEKLTNAQILDWAYQKQGGDFFVAQIQPYHDERLDYLERCAGLIEYSNAA